jgi:hypothetical protein
MPMQQSSSKPSAERASASQSKQVIEMDGTVVDALPNSQAYDEEICDDCNWSRRF